MKKYIDVPLKLRYEMRGKITSETRRIWLICHGYGYLAEYFIKKFEVLSVPENVLIVPQAPSKFYKKGFSGRVGASWMTSEDRLTDIENYVRFLRLLYHLEIPEKLPPNIELIGFGFSQGTATVSRLIDQSNLHFDRLIIWGGMLPPDLSTSFPEKRKELLKNLTYVIGNQDPFLSRSAKETHLMRLEKAGIHAQIKTFDGGHEINKEVLLMLERAT